MAKAELEIGLRFEGAVVRPGDTLVLFIHPPSRLSAAERDRLRELAEAELPGVKVVPVEGIRQALVYRPDAEPLDRNALIDRWAENFGLNLASPVEAALAAQEADHVAELVRRAA